MLTAQERFRCTCGAVLDAPDCHRVNGTTGNPFCTDGQIFNAQGQCVAGPPAPRPVSIANMYYVVRRPRGPLDAAPNFQKPDFEDALLVDGVRNDAFVVRKIVFEDGRLRGLSAPFELPKDDAIEVDVLRRVSILAALDAAGLIPRVVRPAFPPPIAPRKAWFERALDRRMAERAALSPSA